MTSISSECRVSDRVETRVSYYFSTRYPTRGTLLDRMGFRRSHDGAVDFISSLDLQLDCATLLDYGCGDGELLAAVLQAKRDSISGLRVKLVDLASDARSAAVERIAPLVASISDCTPTDDDGARHDIVLAIGVLDYYPDWIERLRSLGDRASRCLIITMPRRRFGGHFMRRAWLWTQHISIERITPAKLRLVAKTISERTILKSDRSTLYCAMFLD